MVNISRAPLSKALLDKLFSILFEALGRKRTHTDFLFAVTTFLSPKEPIQVAKRVAILYLLVRGIEQSAIARALKVSTSTVNKYSLQVNKDSQIADLFSKLLRDDKILRVFLTLMDILFPPGQYGANWQAGWDRRRELERLKSTGL